eukprot:TRINITY_DN3341_c0_g1_i8.p1 TRINITY_DN3341_c0_g1~~TRINITY_DN3341_c0_g1_i8.p1  ORF type:complete len:417 (+),score=55.72 TRINITY_DN3341_c0_g1_i8:161-1411(+)
MHNQISLRRPHSLSRNNDYLNVSSQDLDHQASEHPSIILPRLPGPNASQRHRQKILIGNKPLAEDNMVRYFRKSASPVRSRQRSVNQPQRLELPLYFNTPFRFNAPAKTPAKEKRANVSFSQLDLPPSVDSDVKLNATKRYRDYSILAFACKRAGKVKDEGRAYYSMGVLRDNTGEYSKAIQEYTKFYEICKLIGDRHGEGLAYNCIGVDYQLIGDQKNDRECYYHALKYHQMHYDLSDDAGKFIASLNMGLVHAKLGEHKEGSQHHQEALKYAVKISNPHSQSLAIANLGKIGEWNVTNDPYRLQSFVEKYIDISKEMRDVAGEQRAYVKLGALLADQGEYSKGAESFEKALKLSSENLLDEEVKKVAKFNYGVSLAKAKMSGYLENVYSKIMDDKRNAKANLYNSILNTSVQGV